jgi:hypothetical protein
MKTHLATAPVRHDHPPQHTHAVGTLPVRRVGLLDQAALYIGLALVHWSRRPTRADRRAQDLANIEAVRVRQKAEEYRDFHPTVNPMRFW